jgi:hypothetical protein
MAETIRQHFHWDLGRDAPSIRRLSNEAGFERGSHRDTEFPPD